MSTKVFVRRARAELPGVPDDELVLEPPPEMPRTAPPNMLLMLMPVVMIAMVVGFIVIGGLNPATMMMGMMMVITTVGMMSQGGGNRDSKAQLTTDRNDYLSYLSRVREEISAVRTEQREAMTARHPAPESLPSFVGGPRMWERRPGDEDFLQARLGVGPQALSRQLRPPQTGPVEELEPVSALALQSLVRTHSSVPDVPISVRLSSFATIEVLGEPEDRRSLVRAIVMSAATFHGPDLLSVVAVVDPTQRDEWDWLKWLPHNHSTAVADSLGPVRMVATSMAEVEDMLADQLSARARFVRGGALEPGQRQILVIIDSVADPGSSALMSAGLQGVTVLDIAEATRMVDASAVMGLAVVEGRLAAIGDEDELNWLGAPDRVTRDQAASVAMQLAGFRLPDKASDEEDITPDSIVASSFEDMLGIGDPAQITAESVWKPRSQRDLLNVPIGMGPSGELVNVDIKESALSGMGPHGLVIGATGSGKSELLRTFVLALATTHSPDQLNLVLVDFKGGATFAGLGRLPHVAAVITNLEDDLSMVDRMFDALSGEMNRRQELLRDAGNVVNIREYMKAREAKGLHDLPVLPSLFIVCDEFSELLSQKPDFAELFVAIGRLGRSLGIHLLLASQRLEEGKLRGLDSHLSYRIGLKTFSAQESRVVLGVPDAYELPASPGAGYLKFDTTAMVRFKAAYVSGPYLPSSGVPAATTGGAIDAYHRPITFVSDLVRVPVPEGQRMVEPEVVDSDPGIDLQNAPTTLDVIVSRLEGQGTPAHAVWLPPLDTPSTLDELYGELSLSERGLMAAQWPQATLRFPIGLVDLPYEQRRDPYVLDLSGGAGHAVVVGGPQSGKSTALRTIISSIALTHTPREVQFYVVDMGGGSLGSVARLPHVGGVATRMRTDYLRRMIAEVWTVLVERERMFAELGVESMAEYRRAQGEGRGADGDRFGDVFLVIDGWGAFREEFEDHEHKVTQLAARGLSYGIHVILGVSRWMELRPAIKDAILTRVELRLGDPGESEVGRQQARDVPDGRPGRGLANPSGKHTLIGLPRIDGRGDATSLSQGFDDFARAVSEAWTHDRAPEVRMLPDSVALGQLPYEEGSRVFPLGLDEDTLSPVVVDVEAEPFLVYFADGEMGKSNALRVMAENVMRAYTSDEARILLVDYRRALLDVVPPEYLAGYASGSQQASDFLTDLALLLEKRLPPPDVTAEQLKERSWWEGREMFVLVDDYDLVTGMNENPLQKLLPLLPQARDIGLHVMLVRRTSGASNAMFDSVISAMRNLAALFFIGSGPHDEGNLLPGARPNPSFGPGRGWLVDRKHGARLIQFADAERGIAGQERGPEEIVVPAPAEVPDASEQDGAEER